MQKIPLFRQIDEKSHFTHYLKINTVTKEDQLLDIVSSAISPDMGGMYARSLSEAQEREVNPKNTPLLVPVKALAQPGFTIMFNIRGASSTMHGTLIDVPGIFSLKVDLEKMNLHCIIITILTERL